MDSSSELNTGRRIAAGAAALSIALAGAAWSGCGDDNPEQAGEEAGQAAEEAGQAAEQTAEDAGQEAEEQAEDSQSGSAGGY